MTYYIGLMSGTSADGMDAALVEFDELLPNKMRLVQAICVPYTREFRLRLRQQAVAEQATVMDLMQLDRDIAKQSVLAVQRLLSDNHLSACDIQAIGSHGHTLRHCAQPNGFSWQIGDPSWIAEHTGITCVADFRRRDIAAGGQGAPLVPAFHQHALSHIPNAMVVNIGGIANLSILENTSQPLLGFDTGPGNGLLDEWCQQQWQCARDEGGQRAAQGRVITSLLHEWMAMPYFQQMPPKSTGRELFRLDALGDLTTYDTLDVLSTLTEWTVQSIAHAVRQFGYPSGELLVCGGGVHNASIMRRLEQALPTHRVRSTNTVGIDADWMEAMAFAWLAWRTLQSLPSNAPSVTGAQGERILGAIYPA